MSQLSEREKALVEALGKECRSTSEISTKLKELFAGTLEAMLEGEMDEHLGYEKHSAAGNGSGNSRNGHGRKTMQTEWGESEIHVPRDRNSTFEPQAVAKRQTRTDDMENRVLAMYAKGMSTRDIEDHLQDI